MAFTRYKFLGCSIRGANSQIGWNGASSTLTLQLVEDPQDGDSFSPVPVGTPVFFQFGSFAFFGLLQKWHKSHAQDANPGFEVFLQDPREILEGAQVILSAYTNSVGPVPNIINAYGYWENQGFGLSYSNDAGMPWFRVRDALTTICNQPLQTQFGGPLNYRGVKYSLDLSQLPTPSNSYRVGPATAMTVLDLVHGICEDGACDFFVELQGYQIRIRTVPRVNQPPLGTITAITDTNWGGNVIRSQSGLEARNEPTSSWLIGGEVTTMSSTDSLTSFWGYDVDGNPILGVNARLNLVNPAYSGRFGNFFVGGIIGFQQNQWTFPAKGKWPSLPCYVLIDNEIVLLTAAVPGGQGFGMDWYTCQRGQFGTELANPLSGTKCYLLFTSLFCDQFALNSSPVSDLLGTVSYPCSTLELRLAKGGFTSWAAFIAAYRPNVAALLGLTNFHQNLGALGATFKHNVVNDQRANVFRLNAGAVNLDVHARQLRAFDFVRGYADEYMGRKFAVSLPFVLAKQDPETLKVTFGYDIVDAGYFPEGSPPLGLSDLNQDVFKTPDGRFRCFVVFNSLFGVDLGHVSPHGTVTENGLLYMAAQADPHLLFTPLPAAVVTLPGAVFNQALDAVGDLGMLAATFQMKPDKALPLFQKAIFGNVGAKVFPDYRQPAAVTIPLKSNTLCYGPWFVAGAPGKVKFDQDASLTPWNYGGYATMNAAAVARVTSAVSSMQVSEAGTLEQAGEPAASLGDTLQAGGPNITGIQVSYGTNGVTTTYSFQTYSPRFGVFTKGYTERLRRLALTGLELRKALRASIKEQASNTFALANAGRASRAFLEFAPAAIKRESPHDILMGYAIRDFEAAAADFPGGETPDDGGVRVGVCSATMEEGLTMVNAHDDTEFTRTAAMHWSGLLRPFSTGPSATNMPTYTSPVATGVMSSTGLNPWKAKNDIEVGIWGPTYQSMNPLRDNGNYQDMRALALRGPQVLSGWGIGTDTLPVPGLSGDWHPDYLKRCDLWKVGPMDPLWDEYRGVWTSHDIQKGVLLTALDADGSGYMEIYENRDFTGRALTVHSWGPGNQLPVGSKVHALYNATDNRWYAIPGASQDSGNSSSSTSTVSCHLISPRNEARISGVLSTVNWRASGIQDDINALGIDVSCWDDGPFVTPGDSGAITMPYDGLYNFTLEAWVNGNGTTTQFTWLGRFIRSSTITSQWLLRSTNVPSGPTFSLGQYVEQPFSMVRKCVQGEVFRFKDQMDASGSFNRQYFLSVVKLP